MKIYMDVCCLCRPFDDRTEDRIRIESEAVLTILARCSIDWILVGSDVVDFEISRILDNEKKRNANLLASIAKYKVAIDEGIIARALKFENRGFKPMDALHLSSAEKSADVMLTTDDEILRKAESNSTFITVKIDNPTRWLIDVLQG